MKTKGGTLEEKPRRPARIPRATKLDPMEQEQQKLVQVVQKSPDFIGIATNDGKLLFVNEAGQKMVGIESSEKANSTMIFDYLPADEIARFNREVLPVVLSGKPWSGEMSLRHSRTATPIPFEMRVFPICDAEGRVIAIANVSTDIRPVWHLPNHRGGRR
jgi:PAS domain S-box-containing protein